MKKILALVLALAMVALCAVASAASITITPPDGTTADSKNTYTIYKIFDATPTGDTYTYSLMSGKDDVPANTSFVIDDAGNIYHGTLSDTKTDGAIAIVKGGATKYLTVVDSITQDEQDALKTYGVVVGTIETTGTTAGSKEVDPGYYYIASTTGSLVIVKTTDVTIKDKNEVPPLDKNITNASTIDETGKNAIAQVGTNIEYTLTITKKKGAENYIVYDNLGEGLKYNKDAKVFIGETEQASSVYTKSTETDSALVVEFDNDWMAGLDDNTVVKVVYTALITEDALQTDPANNTAHLEYGHTPGENSTPPVITHTYNAKFSVIKKDGAGQFLGGA
jgi:fimbrial isopeptide formation D2 family protein